MRQIRIQIITIVLFMLSCYPLVLYAGASGAKQSKATRGIFQLVETRNGKKSCWGFIIQLSDLSFKQSIDQDDLTITDAKYARDMKPIMTWAVDNSRKRLTIIFKQGMGDFGSGDDVTVRIRGNALTGEPKQDYVFEIATDIL